MRSIIKFAVVAVIAAAFWMGTTCAAQSYPSGSYQQTCRNIGVNGSALYATCKDGNGNWQSTQLPDYQRCTSEIVNNNGSLQCNGTNGYNGNGAYNNGGYGNGSGPAGSYTQTCRNINTRGNTLEADCDTGNGQWNRTSLSNYQRCGEIANINGTLRCNGNNGGYNNGGHNNGGYNNGGYHRNRDGDDHNGSYQNGWQNGVPPGSYSQSCQDIRVSGNTLSATCRKNNGRNRQATLSNFNQCSNIANSNGKLRCSR